tara:strand:- start:451 stop:693 length:243 start_codon:yes stop_codon:yes gene_type:complete
MKNDKVTETIQRATQLSAELDQLNNDFNLTDDYVAQLRQQVDQLKQHQSRLNSALEILNELPSSISPEYKKADPNPQRRY